LYFPHEGRELGPIVANDSKYGKITRMFKIEKFDLLVSTYILCIALSELMGSKTFPLVNLFGYQLNASVAIFILPIIFTINDIITEVHGKERAKSVVRSGLCMVIFIILFSLIGTTLPPSARFQNSEGAYDKIFGLSARISAASLTAFALAEFLDVFVFVKLKQLFGKRRLWLRNNVSNFVSQLVDTTVFMSLAFWAFDKPFNNNIAFLMSVIIPYWLLKCFMSLIETPFVYWGVHWLKKDNK
jgi:queuosine precursor transporter